eukprot:325880-Chlamydomonas_euryale.AAC.7
MRGTACSEIQMKVAFSDVTASRRSCGLPHQSIHVVPEAVLAARQRLVPRQPTPDGWPRTPPATCECPRVRAQGVGAAAGLKTLTHALRRASSHSSYGRIAAPPPRSTAAAAAPSLPASCPALRVDLFAPRAHGMDGRSRAEKH